MWRLKYNDKLDVDLSFMNAEPFRNTQLLRAYSALGPLVRDLAVLMPASGAWGGGAAW